MFCVESFVVRESIFLTSVLICSDTSFSMSYCEVRTAEHGCDALLQIATALADVVEYIKKLQSLTVSESVNVMPLLSLAGFSRQSFTYKERLLILSNCPACGEARIGAPYDGFLQTWENEHACVFRAASAASALDLPPDFKSLQRS